MKNAGSLFLGVLFCCLVGHTQNNPFKRLPLQTAKLLASKLIRNISFQYRLVPQKPSPAFNEIEFLNFSRTFGPAEAYALSAINFPDTFLETLGTAIFTMAIARGINNGWLNAKTYLPYAVKGWKAIETVVDEDGTLHGTCIGTNMSENIRDYYTRPVANDDTHGILPVLFAGIEVDKMVKKK